MLTIVPSAFECHLIKVGLDEFSKTSLTSFMFVSLDNNSFFCLFLSDQHPPISEYEITFETQYLV
jgi:hypothetical protein